jgi:hypothetical protein
LQLSVECYVRCHYTFVLRRFALYSHARSRGIPPALTHTATWVHIPLTGEIDVFSLRGPPAYYTSIGLGASRGAPHQNLHLGKSPLFIYEPLGAPLPNYATREAFRLGYYASVYCAIPRVNQPNSNFLCNEETFNSLSSTFYYYDISPNTSLFGKDKHCTVYISYSPFLRTPH